MAEQALPPEGFAVKAVEEPHGEDHENREIDESRHENSRMIDFMHGEGVCHFFRLPAELRNQVYELALGVPLTVLINEEFGHARKYPYEQRKLVTISRQDEKPTVDLLLISRQVHYEATPIFYGQTKFKTWMCLVSNFICQIGTSVKYLKSLETYRLDDFYCEGPSILKAPSPQWSLQLGLARNLRHFSIGGMDDKYLSSRHDLVTFLYYFFQHWIKAIGEESGNKFAALECLKFTYYHHGQDAADKHMESDMGFRQKFKDLIDSHPFDDDPHEQELP
ncbi:uncharacterized protein K452DRAFT_304485 [Aplosporella prunicola CBS 121167]|uniref:Uncharacterized protein n=1 Tax=Aplosporella prunicola CBS 121167 TaxID=1176127 RepID=A0A6A6BR18_9PEZI|nr:uncharacterized protein K452DRAFT_304485 [Aplosporella prunicola CBS 121167]KAF2146526.1 hypothetical protein K452DRAFT_304485 [Aplosporella prunicola CBS 121167]